MIWIYFFIFLGLLSHVRCVFWTHEHKICYGSHNSLNQDQSTYEISCRNTDYYEYAINSLANASGFRYSMLHEIINMYDNLAIDRQPVIMKVTNSLNATIYPLSFSIPSGFIVANVPPKEKPFGRVIPDVVSTYYKTAADESTYRQDMSNSLFTITFKKGGWDCLRHYEILAAGSLPLFVDIDKCTTFPLAAHPKGVYRLINKWPGLSVDWHYYSKWGDIAVTKLEMTNINFDVELYRIVVAALLQYTSNVLSTTSMAEYFLQTISMKLLNGIRPKTILYLTHFDVDVFAGDYTTDTLLHGLHTLLNNSEVIDYPCREILYRTKHHFNLSSEYLPTKNMLYGHGYTLGLSLDSWNHTCSHAVFRDNNVYAHEKDSNAESIEKNILMKAYDIVVIASGHRHNKRQDLIKAVCSVYPRDRVVVVDGADGALHPKQIETFSSCAGMFFSREGPHPSSIHASK